MRATNLFLDRTLRPVIAHRGASGLRAENTIPAFELARALGADAMEFDVRVARDGIPVVHHDPTLERTTNLTGLLRARTAAELSRAGAGGGHGVPTLAEVLEVTNPLPVLMELKEPEAAQPSLEVIRRSGAADRVVVASFHQSALRPLRHTELILGASRRDILAARIGAATGWPPGRARCRFYAVPYRWKELVTVPTTRFVRRAHRQGCAVHVWTVDDPSLAATLWDRGVQGILTNRPDLILAERERRYGQTAPGTARFSNASEEL